MKYYIDTNIWLDFLEDRKGFKNEPLGIYAWKLFLKIKESNGKILISDFLSIEMIKHVKISKYNFLMEFLKKAIIKIETSKNSFEKSVILSDEINIPSGDALHVILAIENNAILVSRDKHFKKIKEIDVYRPEELI